MVAFVFVALFPCLKLKKRFIKVNFITFVNKYGYAIFGNIFKLELWEEIFMRI